MKTLARDDEAEEIVRRIGMLRPDSVRRWGRMSAHQMVCHLNDGFRMATGEASVTCAPSLAQRTLIKWMALHIPVRWPTGIRTVPEIDQHLGGTRPVDFAADVADLTRRVKQVASLCGVPAWPPHPIFGKMSEAQWLRWSYLHADHHLRQFGV
jgi:hypothetical protein